MYSTPLDPANQYRTLAYLDCLLSTAFTQKSLSSLLSPCFMLQSSIFNLQAQLDRLILLARTAVQQDASPILALSSRLFHVLCA